MTPNSALDFSPADERWERVDGMEQFGVVWKRVCAHQERPRWGGLLRPKKTPLYDVMTWRAGEVAIRTEQDAVEWAKQAGLSAVSVEMRPFGARRLLSVVHKVRQPPPSLGVMYGATIALPGGYLSVDCQEFGVTGVRSTVVTNRLLAEGWRIDEERLEELVRAVEDERWDAQFPFSPIARVRRYLRELEPQLSTA
ncbi:MAG TPA: hypothetical protein VFT98_09585 [Myxococcota bacterium]|nr:hypothetical protein [Myxococcota bacterium]